VVHAYNLNEELLWALGFKVFTEANPFTGVLQSRVVPVFVTAFAAPIVFGGPPNTFRAVAVEAQANVLPQAPGRFVHFRGCLNGDAYCWFDGLGPYRGANAGLMQRPKPLISHVRIGGTCIKPGLSATEGSNFIMFDYQGPPIPRGDVPEYENFIGSYERKQKYDTILPCRAQVDELRITKAARNPEFMNNDPGVPQQLPVPLWAINAPWTDY
jgi:hypothetical protein